MVLRSKSLDLWECEDLEQNEIVAVAPGDQVAGDFGRVEDEAVVEVLT